ncbi:hypothetical protein [Sagittula sp. S175]|uniref:hypothetical protein n=1 Tax=Sagittula sp. S175 TaxID=3415129 RepID=UPI003C797974
MIGNGDIVSRLLHEEYASILHALGNCVSGDDFRRVAVSALALSRNLMSNRLERGDSKILGVSFFHSPSVKEFLLHDLLQLDPAGGAGIDDFFCSGKIRNALEGVAADLRAKDKILLVQEDTVANWLGEVLVVDIKSISAIDLISFLFLVSLKRSCSLQDLELLQELVVAFDVPDNRHESIDRVLETILESDEAAMQKTYWVRI